MIKRLWGWRRRRDQRRMLAVMWALQAIVEPATVAQVAQLVDLRRATVALHLRALDLSDHVICRSARSGPTYGVATYLLLPAGEAYLANLVETLLGETPTKET